MKVDFQDKFEEVLREESKDFDINWQLVEIKCIRYKSTLMSALPVKLDEYMVRMRVVEDEIPDMDTNKWLRSHRYRV